MLRTYTRASEKHPGHWDRFEIKTRWNGRRGGVDIYFTDAPALAEPATTKVEASAELDYHGELDETHEELLEEGWREV
ncbi:hypothetical protein [Streptomyces spectabilis]|uniref:Uncharacterized protein n=1 Tax=Streptomyces spectabilis TaxID=68270 RepID=A0A516RF63_STRST|nr:hypothetical protein [Streptomyces spectabilis]QDQ14300.1 hypothetical protein FH965_30100 [Streptomyces spectabilis]